MFLIFKLCFAGLLGSHLVHAFFLGWDVDISADERFGLWLVVVQLWGRLLFLSCLVSCPSFLTALEQVFRTMKIRLCSMNVRENFFLKILFSEFIE